MENNINFEGKSNRREIRKTDEIIAFFSNEGQFSYPYRKTERIVTALYMVTDFLSDNEPIKLQVRNKSTLLLPLMIDLKHKHKLLREQTVENFKLALLEISSLLETSVFVGYISEMNYHLLKKEFIYLVEMVTPLKNDLHDFSLPSSLFNVGAALPAQKKLPTESKNDTKILKDISKGQTIKDSSIFSIIAKKRTNRRETILNLVKMKNVINVKDVSEVIKNCSEKTLQRELLGLAKRGVLKKEGERRWSKYSLAKS